MHVLTAQAGRIEDGEEPVDLGQTPGDILVLSSADSELSALTLVAREERLESSFRLANLGQLKHPYSVDLYVSAMVDCAPPPKVIAIRLIGGQSYWPYGLDRLVAAARANAIQLIVVPGDAQWDPALADLSTTPGPVCRRYWQLLVEGGVANLRSALGLLDDLAEGKNADLEASAVKPFQRMGWCDPETLGATGAPQPGSVPIVFYASLMQAGTVAPIRALANALIAHGLRPAPLVVPSLKDEAAQAFLEKALPKVDPPVVINTTAFASSASGQTDGGPLSVTGAPVIQAVLSGASREAWDGSAQGLPATDLIMHVVMPELDGRIHGRAISFKQQGERDAGTQFAPVAYEPEPSGIAGVARLAKRWADLRVTPESQKTVAIVLAHYPSKRSRIGNGVGLDTPASVALFTQAMREAGYAVDDAPTSGAALMDDLLNGKPSEHLPLETYRTFFAGLAPSIQQAITARWGRPEDDPAFADGRFTLPLHRHGKLLIGIQPARGYGVDPEATYHDPDLVPPHAYLAFYAYLQTQAHAVIQFGKHGNLEWLPGKAMALSGGCYPAALLGEVPTLYPFIVNDPGEGCQAKRRTGAVIVDHLMPPLARAESYGPYQELETLLDEYTMAQASDPARARVLADDIVGFAREIGLTEDVALPGDVPGDLAALDTALCDLKELQIRDGLHVFGAAPDGQQTTETLVALARIPSGSAPDQQGLHRALASDLGLGIDPLARAFAQPWKGPKPDALARLSDTPWRSLGDGIERLEAFAQQLVAGEEPAPGPATEAALAHINTVLRPRLLSSPDAETANLLTGLSGRFVPPGPAGAPSRGRPDVLPTGRNFYAVDVRAVPSPTAWKLGQKSAEALVARHFADHGEWLESLVLTCWGTANMRTAGDDIAQALALIGTAPQWDGGAGRVTGFTVTPLSDLGRPRVDVTLRISGFFRDAFPHQIDLFDSAVRAVASLNEPTDMNPIAARASQDAEALEATGRTRQDAERLAGVRVFGSMPGSYGAGLQALIDEGAWTKRADFADAFLAWGGFAYGAGLGGEKQTDLLRTRLATTKAVVHNQDNREHDLLDSDDYYQFEGGLAATIETLRGQAPTSYHMDHSRPEAPHARTLREEIGRVVRGRAANPKWIAGAMRHGYKGGFELAATLDYLFAFAATTHAVTDHHFDAYFEATLGNEEVRDFLAQNNAPALTDMANRFHEALERGLWAPRRNTTQALIAALRGEQITEVRAAP